MKMLKVVLFLTIILSASIQAKAADSSGLRFAINNITKIYFEIKNALLANDPALASNKAAYLVMTLNSIPDKDMSIEQHSLWFNYLGKMQMDSRKISEGNSLGYQRPRFASLSLNLFAVLKGFKMNNVTIYKQYCAGIDSYWLDNSPIIKNPYYGIAEKNMVKSGVTREVLPAGSKN